MAISRRDAFLDKTSEVSEETHVGCGSGRFKATIADIPSPEDELQGPRPKPFTPGYNHLILTIGTPLVFVALGVGLEIGTAISNKSGGFPVPSIDFLPVSGQFLASVIPLAIVVPLVFLYRLHDWMLRAFQPYVVLLRGNASAEESMLLNYIYDGPFFTIFHAMRWKHRIVLLSSSTVIVSYVLQLLAGSIFQIQTMPQMAKIHVTSQEYISLADDIDQLNGFLASAGYVNAAALYGLTDPPFVFGDWSTAAFQLPDVAGLNETITLNTSAITSRVNCANPAGQSTFLNQSSTHNIFTLESTSVDNCIPAETVIINATASTEQYGVVDVICPNVPQAEPSLRPVMFWYINSQLGPPEPRTVFCTPAILPISVMATAHLLDGTVDSCFVSGDLDQTNNVTGPPLNGAAFNGLIFRPSSDPFIEARATAIASGISDTILRTATNQPAGLQAVFALPNGMLDITSKIYTQYLAIAARSLYFRKHDSPIPAEKTWLEQRLWIDPIPGHFTAYCLILTGILGVLVHSINQHQRRNLMLTSTPGSIASITALTARSGFGKLLLPYDSDLQLEKKLGGIKFRLDSRTGAIVADEGSEVKSVLETRLEDNVSLSLLSKHTELSNLYSSREAYQSAIGYPPSVYKTPY